MYFAKICDNSLSVNYFVVEISNIKLDLIY